MVGLSGGVSSRAYRNQWQRTCFVSSAGRGHRFWRRGDLMSTLLANYIHGEWVQGGDLGVALYNPVTAAELVRVSSTGLDLSRAFEFARTFGKAALRELTYAARGEALSACVAVLKRNREKYLETSLVNSGTIQADSCIDIDGAIFTLGYFAKLAVSLGAV